MVLEELTFLLLTPSLVLDSGVELIVPSKFINAIPFSALLSSAANNIVLGLHDLGNLAPFLGFVGGYDLLEDGVLFRRPDLSLRYSDRAADGLFGHIINVLW